MKWDEGQTAARVERARRADASPWLWQGLSLDVVENAFDLADLQPLAETVQPEVGTVAISRHVAGPMAGGMWGEAALLVTFSAVAVPFLAELGKDVYRAFRAALFSAYSKARTWANDRGYHPLAVELERSEGRVPAVFIFPAGMEEDTFENAVLELLRPLPQVKGPSAGRDTQPIIMKWDAASRSWNADRSE